jgi:hypothetical protein
MRILLKSLLFGGIFGDDPCYNTDGPIRCAPQFQNIAYEKEVKFLELSIYLSADNLEL